MTINSISGAYSFYRTSSVTAPKVSASEEGLFEPISTKVSSALSDEYIEQIKACAQQAAADGTNMVDSGYAAMRDAQMKQYVSPKREKAIAQVSTALNNPNRVWKYGENLLDLLGIPYTASVFKGALKTTSEIFNEDGEMIAGYHSDNGYWTSVPTKDETRFQYESNQIYREAYNTAKAEMSAAQQTTPPAQDSGESSGFNVKA